MNLGKNPQVHVTSHSLLNNFQSPWLIQISFPPFPPPAHFTHAHTTLVPDCHTASIPALLSLSPSLKQAHATAAKAIAFATTTTPPRLP
jgi:hypothetical protein